MRIMTAVKVAGASHLILSVLKGVAATGDAPFSTKFLFFLGLGDTHEVNVTPAPDGGTP